MNKRLTTDEFISKAKEVHSEKYDYSRTEYRTSSYAVEIICSVHGIFKQKPFGHLRGRGCKRCARNRNLTTKIFIEEADIIHNYRYDYSKTIYVKHKQKVTIICLQHGSWEQDPTSHLMGCGCPACAIIELGKAKRLTLNEFIRKSRIVHGEKYNYSQSIYQTGKIPLKIICPIHGEFIQTPQSHLRGRGCQKCGGCSMQHKWLDSLKIPLENREIKISNFKVDALMDNTIYEFYGNFWHGNTERYDPNDIHPVNKITFQELYNKTIQREEQLKELGYSLITIWESDWLESQKTL